MTKERYANQLDIVNPAFEQTSVVIIGAGWIGSTTCMCLAQMGIKNITVIDYDEVENHNLASQLYKESDIGLSKVTALQKNVHEFTWIVINTIPTKFKPEDIKDADIVICWVDNMATRKEVMEACTERNKRFIDARMAWQYFEIYNYIPVFEKDLYMLTRYSDKEASPETCTNKSVSFNTFAIAAILSRFVVGIIKDDPFIMKKSRLTVDLANLIIA